MTLPIRESRQNASSSFDVPLDVVVLFTTVELAAAALVRARELVRGIRSHIRLVSTQIVPFPLPVERPPVNLKHLRNELRRAAKTADLAVEGEIVLARDIQTALATVLKPDSIVVLVSQRKLWRTHEQKLKSECEKAGYEVLITYTR